VKKIHRFNITNIDLNKLNLKDILNIYQKDNQELINQWCTVLKFKEGEIIKLFTGRDNVEYLFQINAINKKSCEMILLEKISRDDDSENKLEINLFLSIFKNEFEEGLRFATELGVTNIYPVISERTVRKEINIARLQKIVIESSEQCGRMNIPSLHEVQDLKDILNSTNFSSQDSLNICYHTQKTDISHETKSKYSQINIFIGPEGGWSETELTQFKSKDVWIRNLSNINTLRAVTATAVCIFDAINIKK
jgi:16S rRNA (uracil1498-N3)-methyltransferase